jgi:crotonobetainyl-CoA:carnitine CoA-transferase CaiB-like acyl-CoA transferase
VGGEVVAGPVLDADQLGYGAAYRLYAGGDGSWLVLAVTDQAAWDALRRFVDGLPATPPPLRTGGGEPQPAEAILEAAFRTEPAGDWAGRLGAAGVPVELVPDVDRAAFIAGILDDPTGRQLGRVVGHELAGRGWVEQVRLAPRLGPRPRPHPELRVPALGEHTAEVLGSL